MGLPIHDAARRAIAHAGHVLADGIEHAETDLSKLTHHARYHQQQAPATTATEAPVPGSIATLEADAEKVRSTVEEFVASKLPAATEDLKKIEGLLDHPVVVSLLNAIHVPTEALSMAVKVIDGLEELYKPDTAAQAPSEPVAAEPAPVAAAATS